MTPAKNTGRILGLLFLIIILCGATSLNFRGLGSTLLGSENLLLEVFEQSFSMKLAIVLDLAASLLWLGVAIYLFPYIKNISRSLALWYVALWIVQLCTVIMSDISHLSLINLSQQVNELSDPNMEHYNTLAKVLVNEYFWGHFLALMAYSSATFLLFIVFFKGKWIPRIISVWGMAAMLIVFSATVAQLFDVDVDFVFYQQNGYHFIFMTLWLLIKGFSTKKS